MGKVSLSSGLSRLAGDGGIVGFDGPGILGIGRDNIVACAPIRSRIGDGGIGAGSNSFANNFWGWVYLNRQIKGSSSTSSANWGERVDDGLLRIGGIP